MTPELSFLTLPESITIPESLFGVENLEIGPLVSEFVFP
jgi:hypothetical protein